MCENCMCNNKPKPGPSSNECENLGQSSGQSPGGSRNPGLKVQGSENPETTERTEDMETQENVSSTPSQSASSGMDSGPSSPSRKSNRARTTPKKLGDFVPGFVKKPEAINGNNENASKTAAEKVQLGESETSESITSSAGSITSIALKNFLQLPNKTYELNEKVHFILDENPKRKEYTGTNIHFKLPKLIFVAFGGKPPGDIKGLISTGHKYCSIKIVLDNQGSNAFEPCRYGSSIIIIRKIKQDGRTSLSLRSDKEEELSSDEEDLKKLLASFKIFTQLPVSVLCRLAIRGVFKLSANEKYQLFSTLCVDFDKKEDSLFHFFDFDKRKEEILNIVKDLEHEKSLKEEAQSLRQQLEALETEYSWAKVNKYQADIVKFEDTYAIAENELRLSTAGVMAKLQLELNLMTEIGQLREMPRKNGIRDSQSAVSAQNRSELLEQKQLRLAVLQEDRASKEKEKANFEAEVKAIEEEINATKKLEAEERAKAEAGRHDLDSKRDLPTVEVERNNIIENLDRLESQMDSDLSVEQLAESIAVTQESSKSLEDKLENLKDLLPHFSHLLDSRNKTSQILLKTKGDVLSSNYQKILTAMARCVKGRLEIDHVTKKIGIKQIEMTNKHNCIDVGCLSSPENEISDIKVRQHKLLVLAYIAALYMSSDMRLFIIGGLEAFLDSSERRLLIELILLAAREKPCSQLVFLLSEGPPWTKEAAKTKNMKVFNIKDNRKRPALSPAGPKVVKKEKKEKKD